MNNLYKDAICNFQDDIRFWIAYVKFCKHVVSNKNKYKNFPILLYSYNLTTALLSILTVISAKY